LLADRPTAIQAVSEVHETPFRALRSTPGGAADVSRLQDVPSQCSAKPERSSAVPTAVHAVAKKQDTAVKGVCVAPVGFGVAERVHATPSQASASVVTVPSAEVVLPTAVHLAAVRHDTPVRVEAAIPAGSALASTLQEDPFHDSIRVRWFPEASVSSPAAAHHAGVGHDTARNVAAGAPSGPATADAVQWEPSQRSASGCSVAPVVAHPPTAQHDDAKAQEAPDRVPCGVDGLGLG
jgi:hypothetical protein